MPKKLNLKPGFFYTLGEEIANAITHGVGSALAVAGTVILIVNAVGDPWKVVSASIYGFSMILLFTMSCLYHAITNQRAKRIIRVFDHTSIFVLIAGTYTPFTLVTLRGWVGWTIFGIVWGAAVFGISSASNGSKRCRWSAISPAAGAWSSLSSRCCRSSPCPVCFC